jgi:carbon storage regulator
MIEGGQGMLVLSRKVNESVVIGDDIVVMVLEMREGKVRLGFKAPGNISIHRKEVKDAIDRDRANGEAAKT